MVDLHIARQRRTRELSTHPRQKRHDSLLHVYIPRCSGESHSRQPVPSFPSTCFGIAWLRSHLTHYFHLYPTTQRDEPVLASYLVFSRFGYGMCNGVMHGKWCLVKEGQAASS